MVWPIIIAIAIAVATVAYIYRDDIAEWGGKKLAVLGARGVGKTTLIRFLETGEIPESYEQTVGPESTERRRFRLKDLKLNIKRSRDLPGGPQYGEWKKLHDEADLVLYLLRVDKLMKNDTDYEARVRRDMEQIGGWLKDRPQPVPFFLIGTHCDLTDLDLTTLPPDEIGDYGDSVGALPIIIECVQLAGGAQHAKTVLGSLKSKKYTEVVVYQIFAQLQAWSK